MLSDKSPLDKAALSDFFENRLDECNIANFAILVRLSGRISDSGSNIILKDHLPMVAERLATLQSGIWSFNDISQLLFGLQTFTVNNQGYLHILSTMESITGASLGRAGSVSIKNISMSLYCFRDKKCFERESHDMLGMVARMIRHCDKPFDSADVSAALYCLSKMNSENAEVRKVLSALIPRFEGCKKADEAQHISIALYGMQGMRSEKGVINEMITALIPMISNCDGDFSSQSVGNSLYGLKRMSSGHAEVRTLLTALLPMIQKCKDTLEGQAIVNALYGLQGMSSEYAEVRSLISALTPMIVNCKTDLNNQGISSAFYGMQGMGTESPEVCGLISALIPKVIGCTDEFTGQTVGNVFYGMKEMSSKSSEVRALISALIPKIQACSNSLLGSEAGDALHEKESNSSVDTSDVIPTFVGYRRQDFNSQELSNTLYGLQGMNIEHAEVRSLLSTVTPIVRNFDGIFNAQAVGNALYGLQGMSSGSDEVRDLMMALHPIVDNCSERLSSQAIGNALYGILTLIGSPGSSELVDILHSQLVELQIRSQNFRLLLNIDLINLCQSVCFALPLLSKVRDVQEYKSWEMLLRKLKGEIGIRKVEIDANSMKKSPHERRIQRIASQTFKKENYQITFNYHLFNTFESDIVIDIPTDDGVLVLNIEVDGIHHLRTKKKLFCLRRDAYLNSRNVHIYRINTIKMANMDDDAIKKWLKNAADEVISLSLKKK